MPNYYYMSRKRTIGKRPIVLIDFGTWELTLREAIFAISICSVLIAIGIFIANSIANDVQAKQLKYRQAAQIDKNVDEFKWALDTDIGNAFVEGHLKAFDPVSHEKLVGKWLSIDASYQKYQKHTRVVHYTVTDSKGRTHRRTRTETYWSWDTYERWRNRADVVDFLGVRFHRRKFDFSACYTRKEVVHNGLNRRIVFHLLPAEMDGSFFSKLNNKTISNGTLFMQGMNLKKIYEYSIKSCAVQVFWLIWIALIIGIVMFFFYAENTWLEDNG